jgi:hypothetical protein
VVLAHQDTSTYKTTTNRAFVICNQVTGYQRVGTPCTPDDVSISDNIICELIPDNQRTGSNNKNNGSLVESES